MVKSKRRVNPVVLPPTSKAAKRRAKKKATPFADAGEIIGSKLGAIFNYPILRGAGRWLGSGIGNILGSGDYELMGPMPKYNVLMSDAQIPKFSTTRQTNVVCHREYIADISGTAAFTLAQFALNPGLSNTFPWLSTVAENYQEYRFHGLIFEFRSLITDFVSSGAPGVVIAATNYNADAPLFNSKQEMENSEYAVATKPTLNLVHAIECDVSQTILPERFVRTGSVPSGQDLRLYDLGNVQLATQGNPVQLLGELWVSYCVEFYKPILPVTVGGNVAGQVVHRTGGTGVSPLGTTFVSANGPLGLSVTATNVAWIAEPGNNYQLTVTWSGTAATVAGPVVTNSSSLKLLTLYAPGSGGYYVPANGVSAATYTFQQAVTCIASGPALASIAFSTGGTVPTASDVSIELTTIDSTMIYT